MNPTPTLETHVPLKGEITVSESNELTSGRPDLPVPTIWQQSVQVKHRMTGENALIWRFDHRTNMFRAYYTERGETDPATGKPAGKFSDRTEWEMCADWIPQVTLAPRELERRAARVKLDEEICKLDSKELAAVTVLLDGDDPVKGLAKLNALRSLGMIKGSPEALADAAAEVKLPAKEPEMKRPSKG